MDPATTAESRYRFSDSKPVLRRDHVWRARSVTKLPSVGAGIALYVVFLFSITVHEFSHALAAEGMGDPTPRYAGRLTLNPIPHMNLFGTVVLPILGLVLGGYVIGYASTPVNPDLMRDARRGRLAVSLAGPAANVVFCLLAVVAARSIAAGFPGSMDGVARAAFGLTVALAALNALLFVFNLMPVPPLDGAQVIRAVLSDEAARSYDRISNWGFLIVLAAFPILGRYVFGPLNRLVLAMAGAP